MKAKLLRNLSANTIQLVINQLAALLIFYLLSTGLNKTDFGLLNLSLAILLVAFNLLSLGIDQVIIRKVASGDNPKSLLSLYAFHVLATGMVFYGLLYMASYYLPLKNNLYPILLLIASGKLMVYFSMPFKQIMSGLELFKPLAIMLTVSNIVRSIGLLIFALLHIIVLKVVIILFITGDLLELTFCAYFFKRATNISPVVSFTRSGYLQLLRDALPQTGVTFITSAMARFDWIYIGFVVSAVKLAEYSFAYKVFEMATLPLLVVAPLLIPWFVKLFKHKPVVLPALKLLLRVEMVIAACTILFLNLCWSLVIGVLTAGKYGAINIDTIFILSLCIPFIYINNFLWTIYFAQGRMNTILKGFIITFLVNITLNLILIPYLINPGAALSFLLANITQTVFYLVNNTVKELNDAWHGLIACTASAVFCIASLKYYGITSGYSIGLSTILFLLLLLITKQVKRSDYATLRNFLFN